MPLQNRVTPTGEIIAVAERGMFTGNRGIIHDPEKRTLLKRRWSTRAWLICLLEFRGRHRDVMVGRHWTELFFLDEATALAAGHRPCFFCRRETTEAFRAAWEDGNVVQVDRLSEIDDVLHSERLDGKHKRLHPLTCALDDLPDGAMLQSDDDSYLAIGGTLRRWTPAGYQAATTVAGPLMLLTPPSTVQALRAGYRADLHPSAYA